MNILGPSSYLQTCIFPQTIKIAPPTTDAAAKREVEVLIKLSQHDYRGKHVAKVIEVFKQVSITKPGVPVYYIIMEL